MKKEEESVLLRAPRFINWRLLLRLLVSLGRGKRKEEKEEGVEKGLKELIIPSQESD